MLEGHPTTLKHDAVNQRKITLTRCAMPRAPPPPRTIPTDFPQSLLASRAKSLAYSALRGCEVVLDWRYFCKPLSTLDFRIFNAVTAAGSCATGPGVVGEIRLLTESST